MKNIAIIVCALPFLAFAMESIQSPDGRLEAKVGTKDGRAFYSISYDGREVIEPSRLGLVCDLGSLSENLEVKGVERSEFTDEYSVPTIKKSHVKVAANRMKVDFGSFAVLFHVSDNDVAFRYSIAQQKRDSKGTTRCVRILDELTGFAFPEGTTGFLTPQSDAMIGWERSKPSYEEEYVLDVALPAKSKYGHGWTFPALFREGEMWVLLGETQTDSYYCGCRLDEFSGRETKIAFPMAEENNGNGTSEPGMGLPAQTPWRTITVGSTLKPIVETTIAWDLVKPKYEAKKYRYGKSAWSWILWGDNSMNWADQVQYVDFASQMGWQYVLVDNWWADEDKIGHEKMKELVEYAASRGVEIFLWYNSCGYWNDIVASPMNIMNDAILRKKEMRWMKELGVKGIKVDFWGGDKQETMRLYEQVLSDADDNDLMVIFHGCTIPRGWERMYPNYVGSEAVLASENRYFKYYFCAQAGKNASLHPFIRNSLGAMEYGGTFLNSHMSRDNKRRHERGTTIAFELATAILFQNPIQNFALAPNNLHDAPQEAIEFMKKVPTTWDDTRFLAGYPGKYVALARKSEGKWYVAAVSAEAIEFELDLEPFGGAKEKVSLGANDGFWKVL